MITDDTVINLLGEILKIKTITQLADEIKVTRSTVLSWVSLSNLPHQALRIHLVKYIGEELVKHWHANSNHENPVIESSTTEQPSGNGSEAQSSR